MLQTAHKRVQSQDYLSAHVYEYTIETTPEEAKHKQARPHPCSPELRSGRQPALLRRDSERRIFEIEIHLRFTFDPQAYLFSTK